MRSADDFLSDNLIDLWCRLRDSEQPKIAIFGQPGAGKSCLLTNMVGGVLDMCPAIGVETDKTSWSTQDESPIFYCSPLYTFIDVPGYGTNRHPTEVFVDFFPFSLVDAFILVFSGKLLSADEIIFKSICSSGVPFCVVRNFSENMEYSHKKQTCIDIKKMLPGDYSIIFSSNRNKKGISKVYDWIHAHFGN